MRSVLESRTTPENRLWSVPKSRTTAENRLCAQLKWACLTGMPKLPFPDRGIDPKYTPFKLSVRESKIHARGVYAEEPIPPNRKVIEYTGERLNRRDAKRRDSSELTYLFAVDQYWTLDGAVGGSGAELINHSCEPNLISRVMKGHVLYMSLREIRPGEELTVDYNFPSKTKPERCQCGSKKCRGMMQLPRTPRRAGSKTE